MALDPIDETRVMRVKSAADSGFRIINKEDFDPTVDVPFVPEGEGDKKPEGEGDKKPEGEGDKKPEGEGDKKQPEPKKTKK